MSSKSTLTLKQFVVRREVLKLYRQYMDLMRQVEDEGQRRELKEWIRWDFRQNKHLTDEVAIKMQLSRGKNNIKRLTNTVILPRTKPPAG